MWDESLDRWAEKWADKIAGDYLKNSEDSTTKFDGTGELGGVLMWKWPQAAFAKRSSSRRT